MRAILLALLLASSSAWAETNVCTVLGPAPVLISAPGSYCLENDLAISNVDGTQVGISIEETSDVVLDCNGFSINGDVLPASDGITADNNFYAGIHIGSSKRVAVRNCVVNGFYRGIAVERVNGGPRSVDIAIEDNRIDGSLIGLLFISEGNGVVSGNFITNALHTALSVYIPPTAQTQTHIRENGFSRIGNPSVHIEDTSFQLGPPVFLQGGGGSAWLIFEGNLIAEAIAPPGTQTAVILLQNAQFGVGFSLVGNTILAPADAADAGSATLPIVGFNGTNCRENIFVGYGPGPVAACADPSNNAY